MSIGRTWGGSVSALALVGTGSAEGKAVFTRNVNFVEEG
jgi:hypothetical protein